MPDIASLTLEEARTRSALVSVQRYDIAVDLRDLFGGSVLESTSTITFTCREPGAATFVDCVADVRRATLNGTDLDIASVADGRIPLPDLQAENVLVVHAAQPDTASGSGVLRTVDPSDKLVYVWTSFEPDEARRLWACFDQPDLKAPHAFVVHAPETWTVLSNCGPSSVEDADHGRVWTFPDTPPLSTYVVVINAGPFHELRSRRGGYDLGIYCRQSLRDNFERDAEDLFTWTAQGLAWFGEQFGLPFPQERYDQVFVPNMGGAMENWGCVTWGDGMVSRSAPTYNERCYVANVLLHEMAHQWFGDLVTMRWWDDLWLNEAFASWAADWALAGATEFGDAWASFLATDKLIGYRDDMGPATHPIRADVPDVAHATANFDAITYIKGQSVLKQLSAYVGAEAFTRGLQTYFRDHAWGNTVLDDLISAVAESSGRQLAGWTEDWLDRSGADTLTLQDGALLASGPDGEGPRPHRLDIGCFDRRGDALVRTGTVEVEVAGPRTDLDLPGAALHLVNDGDLTFASVRTDAESVRTILDDAGRLPDPLSRALAVTTAWDMLVRGELGSGAVVDCLLDTVRVESSPAVVEPFLALAQRAVERWTAAADVPDRLVRLAATAVMIAEDPDHRQAALRTLASAATEPGHFELLDEAIARDEDTDLAWRVLARRAELGRAEDGAIEALLDRDPDPDASAKALGVRAAMPDEDAKAEVWKEIFQERSVPAGSAVYEVASYFWRPTQTELLLPWAHRFFDEAENVRPGGMLAIMSLIRATYPIVGDESVLERARTVAQSGDVLPQVRSTLLTGADTLNRMLRARSA